MDEDVGIIVVDVRSGWCEEEEKNVALLLPWLYCWWILLSEVIDEEETEKFASSREFSIVNEEWEALLLFRPRLFESFIESKKVTSFEQLLTTVEVEEE